MNEIPLPAITRLCALYQLLGSLDDAGVRTISSGDLSERLGYAAHNVRKDISYLGVAGNTGAGYEISKLRELIAGRFGFSRQKRVCIVGLGRLGSAIMQHSKFAGGEFSIVAGFDSNVNKVETIKTTINLFPAYQITEIVQRMAIELAIIAVPASSAQDVADRLAEGGVQGIVNFSPTVIKPKREGIQIRNMDITGELRILSALVRVRPIS